MIKLTYIKNKFGVPKNELRKINNFVAVNYNAGIYQNFTYNQYFQIYEHNGLLEHSIKFVSLAEIISGGLAAFESLFGDDGGYELKLDEKLKKQLKYFEE